MRNCGKIKILFFIYHAISVYIITRRVYIINASALYIITRRVHIFCDLCVLDWGEEGRLFFGGDSDLRGLGGLLGGFEHFGDFCFKDRGRSALLLEAVLPVAEEVV